jgi:hypothetical protein
MKANESKSIHVTLTIRRDTCPPVHINNVQLPQIEDVKYLGIYTLTGDLPGTNTFRKTETTRNHPHQIALVIRTQVKALYTQQTSHI